MLTMELDVIILHDTRPQGRDAVRNTHCKFDTIKYFYNVVTNEAVGLCK